MLYYWTFVQNTQKGLSKEKLFECTKHSCDINLMDPGNAVQYASHLEDVKRAVCGQLIQLQIVSSWLGGFPHADWFLLSSLPMLPEVLDKEDFFIFPYSKKSIEWRSWERDFYVAGKARLIALPLVKHHWRNYCKQRPMCGRAPSCIKIFETRHCRSGVQQMFRVSVCIRWPSRFLLQGHCK